MEEAVDVLAALSLFAFVKLSMMMRYGGERRRAVCEGDDRRAMLSRGRPAFSAMTS